MGAMAKEELDLMNIIVHQIKLLAMSSRRYRV
jgi:hypothetical protein